MIYKMFLNTLAKMNDDELDAALKKAKDLLSDNDYARLLKMVQEQKK